MNLKEPKRKKRVRVLAKPSLPVLTDENGQWTVYTAHLSASGTCMVDPVEMEAVYSMGFFGKGSLSRSFPSFGRRRFGAPPIVRNRQWVRRQKWLEELQSLNDSSNVVVSEHLNGINGNGSNGNFNRTLTDEESCNDNAHGSALMASMETEIPESNGMEMRSDKECESTPRESVNKKSKDDDSAMSEDATEIEKTENEGNIQKSDDSWKNMPPVIVDESAKSIVNRDENNSSTIVDSPEVTKNVANKSGTCEGSAKVDEVVLDSTEDEECCEILEKGSIDEKDVYFLNEMQLADESADNFQYRRMSETTAMEDEQDPYEVLVLPDTDSDSENYLTNVKSRIEKEGFPINETLHLTFEETFFLMYGLGCLQLIHYDGSIFSIRSAWNQFQLQDKYFIQKYVVYHYFRSKGWIVKPGLKFGGDFLLYKEGPPFYHASYIVIIEVVDADTLLRDDGKSMRTVTWKNLIGLERLSETIAKEILFAQILWPSSVPRNGTQIPVDALSEFTVRELLWRRWNPKRKQDFAPIDDDDSDTA